MCTLHCSPCQTALLAVPHAPSLSPAVLQAATERQEVAAAVARQTVQKLMGELSRSEAAARGHAETLAQREEQLASLEAALAAERATAAQQREAAEREAFLLREELAQQEATGAQCGAELEVSGHARCSSCCMRDLSTIAAMAWAKPLKSHASLLLHVQAQLAALQSQLESERVAAAANAAELQCSVDANSGEAAEAAARLHAGAQHRASRLSSALALCCAAARCWRLRQLECESY